MYTSVVCGIISNQYIFQETQLNRELNYEQYKQTAFDNSIWYIIRPTEITDIYLEIVKEGPLSVLDVLGTLYDCEEEFSNESTYDTLINSLTRHFLNSNIPNYALQPCKHLGNFKSVHGETFRYTYLDGDEPCAIMKSSDTTWETLIDYACGTPKVQIKCGDTVCRSSDIQVGDEVKFLKYVALCKLYARLGLRKR